ncbi:MAG: STAS domain-containing protein [Mycobacteriaceae bacterium]|nr:STAS domain-containing protein [Mycobacteriaceae bacterium]MBV9638286.1 STAS domain-containing protein [Mycobacteriaceae bacterium]
MTVTTSGMNLTSRYANPTFDCAGATIRAHCRHLATVVTVSGSIDALNVERIGEYTRRFVRAGNPVVLDLSGVDAFAAVGISLLYLLDEDCRAAELEWLLVPSPSVGERLSEHVEDVVFPVTSSVRQALRRFADAIAARRQLLLPLIRKTA